MSHEVETMAWIDEVPWHGLGVQLTGNESTDEIIKKAGLDWTVSTRKIYCYTLDETDVTSTDDWRMITRDSDNKILGPCGPKYIPTQNHELFKFISEFCSVGGMSIETAGSLNGGKNIWVLAALNEGFMLPGNDRVNGYLLVNNPHIYGKALSAFFTSIRVVCNNTLQMAFNGSAGGAMAKHLHLNSFDNLAHEAMKIKLIGQESLEIFRKHCELLQSIPVTPELLTDFYMKTFSITEEMIAEEKLPAMLPNIEQARLHAPGHQDTLWGAVNAVTYFVDHVRGEDLNNRIQRAWFGDGNTLKNKAFNVAIDLADAA